MSTHTTNYASSFRESCGVSLALHGALATIVLLSVLFLKKEIPQEIILIPEWPSPTYDPADSENKSGGLIPRVDFSLPADRPRLQNTQVSTPVHERMSFSEFQKRYGTRRPDTIRGIHSQPDHRAPVVPQTIQNPNLTPPRDSATTLTHDTGVQNAMESYFARLAHHIRAAHKPPEGLRNKLVVRIEYFVAANGTISAINILHSSGNPAFDESVRTAFRMVTSIGSRPDGVSDSRVADFYMREED